MFTKNLIMMLIAVFTLSFGLETSFAQAGTQNATVAGESCCGSAVSCCGEECDKEKCICTECCKEGGKCEADCECCKGCAEGKCCEDKGKCANMNRGNDALRQKMRGTKQTQGCCKK